MGTPRRTLEAILVLVTVVLGAGTVGAQSGGASDQPAPKGQTMIHHARGGFDVKLTPLESSAGKELGRMSINKTFHGELDATSKGEMLAAMTSVHGSAGYVAIEKVTGKLAGRDGTFVLQHLGTMTRGEGKLTVTVVPDSGTGQLVGLAGRMSIEITHGKHLYHFEYSLPAEP